MRQRLELDERERVLVRQAAALAGDRSVAAFCRRVVLEAAEEVVRSEGRSERPAANAAQAAAEAALRNVVEETE